MAYLALYRRFRPSGFDSLVGQEHVVRTLVNQIKNDKIGHAYLFCGARGTGKTSAAKIFARAINCLSPVNGSPCGECAVCRALADGANLDVVEMDAASNNKVENVREIRDKIQYPPVSGRYKVYIIDEVHMLTPEAFNALLKTLEEPPKHAVFILATTEVHKLPSTILSRCMRFDFRLIPTPKIAELIGKIYREIGKDYDDDAINEIARAGAGSIRDALSIADICVSYREDKLTYSDVLEVLGATDGDKILSLIGNIFDCDTGEMLKSVEELADSGKSIGVLCKDIIARLREIVVCKTCKDGKAILSLPSDVYEKLVELGKRVDANRLLRIIEIFSETEGNLKYTTSPRAVLETASVKASLPAVDYNIDALLSRVATLEKKIAEGNFAAERPKVENVGAIEDKPRENNRKKERVESSFGDDFGCPVPPPEEEPFIPFNEPIKRVEPKKAEQPVASAANIAPSVSMSAGKLWGTVVRKLRADRNIVLWVACQDMTAKLNGKTLVILANDESGYNAVVKEQNLTTLVNTVKTIGDYDVKVELKTSTETDDFDEGVERLKRNFGVDKIEIKD